MCVHDGGLSPAKVLLVDDGPTEAVFVERALRDLPTLDLMHVAKDGVEAMAFLRQEGEYANVRLPDLILLDINMPKKDGYEVLNEIRDDPDLCHLPVIMFTTSSDPDEVHRAHAEGANAFITKPNNLADLGTIMSRLADFWVKAATLPKPAQEPEKQKADFWQM